LRPAITSLTNTIATNQGEADARSQVVQVPIDEIQAVGLKITPTFNLDDVQSVTLKSFRKVVGYDTFDSILKKDRSEKKDPSDYYNITVSMMVRRKPEKVKTFNPEEFEKSRSSKEELGNYCGNIIYQTVAAVPYYGNVAEMAGRITGMMIDKDSEFLQQCLSDHMFLSAQVFEAFKLLS